MARTRMNHEDLAILRTGIDMLVKAGEESLRKAYALGQIIDAFQNFYTYGVMAKSVDRAPDTLAKYAVLYRRYDSINDLLAMSRRYQTYDVGILKGSSESLSVRYGHQCNDCGSWNTAHRRLPEAAA